MKRQLHNPIRARGSLLGVTAAVVLLLAAGAAAERGQGGPLDLLMIPEVQRELRVEEAQLEQLRQVGQEMSARARELFKDYQNLSPEERDSRRTRFMTEYHRRVGDVLAARQMARLKELSLQQEGLRSVRRRDVADELKLTDSQRQRVEAAAESEREEFRRLFAGVQRNGVMTDEQRDEMRRRFREIRAGTEARISLVLTEAQRRQFQAMQGAPFKFPERRRRTPRE